MPDAPVRPWPPPASLLIRHDLNSAAIEKLEGATYRALGLADLGRVEAARAALLPLIPDLRCTATPWLEARNLRRAAAERAQRIDLTDEAGRFVGQAERWTGKTDDSVLRDNNQFLGTHFCSRLEAQKINPTGKRLA